MDLTPEAAYGLGESPQPVAPVRSPYLGWVQTIPQSSRDLPMPKVPAAPPSLAARSPQTRQRGMVKFGQKTPPGAKRPAVLGGQLLGSEAVGALDVGVFEGLDGVARLLAQCAAQKAADRMRLPAGSLHEFLQCHAAGPFQQVEDLRRFAAGAGGSDFLRARGLSGRLGLQWRGVGASYGNAGLLGCSCVYLLGLHFCGLSFGGSRRVTTFIALLRQRSKSILEKALEQFSLAIPAWLTRDFAQPQFAEESSVGYGEKQNVFLDRRRQMQQNHDLSEARRGNVAQPR